MKFYIKSKNETQWNEITEYVHLPSVRMFFTVDGTFNEVKFTLRTPKSSFGLDLTKPIPPKYQIKVSEVDNESLENENNTWHFITTNINNAIVRKEVRGDDNKVLVNSLYIQEVNANDIISKLDNRYLPNYTVTQPKTRFFNTFVKGGAAEFRIQNGFSQDGSPIVLPQGSKRNLGSIKLNGEMLFGYDSVEGKHYIEFNEIDEVALSVDIELSLQKTAQTFGRPRYLGIRLKRNITAVLPSLEQPETTLGLLKLNLEIKNYKNNLVVNQETQTRHILYDGGEVETSDQNIFSGKFTIKSLGRLNTVGVNLQLNKNENYDKVRIYIGLEGREEHNNSIVSIAGSTFNEVMDTDIPGYNNDSYVKTYIDSLIIRGRTGSYDTEIDEKYITLLEFVNKAIFDYNLNSNDKVKLANDVIPLLSVPMKESEWNDYTLRELLERAFKYVGIIPVLRPNNEITYAKTQKVARYIDLEQVGGKEGEHLTDDYYDKVVSSAKNLVSEKDFITEVIPLSSTETDFSRIRDKNACYITSHDIYFVSNAILHTPELSFTIGSQTINTNMDKPEYWDITSRLFEEDIYNSFPNVRLDWEVGSEDESPRALSSLLTKANTIYYTSGSNVIRGLFNQGEYVQDFDFWGGIKNLFSPGYVAEYAITELLIVLAYSQVGNPFGANMPQPDINLSDMKNWELHLTYVPIFDEITTKYLSNMENRKNLDWEKKLNLRDRVISYENNEEILRNEMERKGNVKELFTEKYEKLSDSIPVNAIVNDNLYVTSKQVSIYHNLVEVEYVLQKNFILQNEDIRLPVEFERYNVPYEYVRRELQIENHIIFMREYDKKYNDSKHGSTKQFFEEVFLNENYPLDGTLYAKMNIDDRLYLMRVGKLDTRFTMILSGKFLDNYTAGLQRYVGANENELYSIPLSYTDGQGKFNLLKDLEIGYNNSIEPLRLKRVGNEPYDVKQFPVGEYDDLEVDLNVKLIDLKTNLMMMKDAREQVSITHTSYLQNETQEIKFYRFRPITNLGFMIRDVELSDDLKLFGIDYEDFNFSYSFEIEEMSVEGSYRVKVISDDIDYFELGIVFINEFDGQYTLVGALKNPIINGNVLEFYVTTTRTGIIDHNINSFRGLLVILITNVDLVDGEVLDLNENIDLEVEFSANPNLHIKLNDQISIYQSDTLSLEESISGEIYTYIARKFLDNDFALSIYTISEVLSIESDIIDLEEDLGVNIAYSSDSGDAFIGIYDLNITVTEQTSYIQSTAFSLINYIQPTLSYSGGTPLPPKTEQPTINSASCYEILHNNTTELHLSITNNDAQEVTIYRGDTSIGTIPGGSTRTLSYGTYNLPETWRQVKAQASGRSMSNLETKVVTYSSVKQYK